MNLFKGSNQFGLDSKIYFARLRRFIISVFYIVFLYPVFSSVVLATTNKDKIAIPLPSSAATQKFSSITPKPNPDDVNSKPKSDSSGPSNVNSKPKSDSSGIASQTSSVSPAAAAPTTAPASASNDGLTKLQPSVTTTNTAAPEAPVKKLLPATPTAKTIPVAPAVSAPAIVSPDLQHKAVNPIVPPASKDTAAKVTDNSVAAQRVEPIKSQPEVITSTAANAMPGALKSLKLQDLMIGEVPVPQQGASTQILNGAAAADDFSPVWRGAFRQALNQVLVKLTGNPGVATLPAVRSQFVKVMPWVQSYDTISVKLGDKTYSYLKVIFDQGGVLSALQSANQKVWTTDRPTVLLYVVVGVGDQAKLVSATSELAWFDRLRFAARLRGINVVFPNSTDSASSGALPAALLAKEDRLELSDDQVRSLESLYGANNVLLGRIATTAEKQQLTNNLPTFQPNNNNWSSDWWLKTDAQSFAWTQFSNDEWSLSQKVNSSLANMLANESFAVESSGPAAAVTVNVANVHNLRQYQAVVRQLLLFAAISGVQLQQASASSVDLQVSVAGGADYLLKLLQQHSADGALTVIDNTLPSSAAPSVAAGGKDSSSLKCDADLCLKWHGSD